MHKVDEHRISGKDADGFIEKVGEETPLSHLAVTAPPEGSLCVCCCLRLALQPVQCQAEEKQRAYGVAESLRAELVIGVGQINQRIAFDSNCLVAALHIPGNACRKNYAYHCAVLAQESDEFFPVAGCQGTAHKNKQIMQGKIVEAIIKKVFSQNAPTRCIQTGVRCPPVKSELKYE